MGTLRLPRLSGVDPLNRRLVHGLLSRLAEEVPAPDAQHWARPMYTVAIVTDTFMFNYYAGAFAHLVPLRYPDYRTQFERHRFDLLIYVTCWEGHDDDYWKYPDRRRKRAELTEIIGHARRLGIPAVFQSIEDPVHYETFLDLARACDWVLTTDEACIDRYRRDLGHARVMLGEYGINPVLHNPLGSPLGRLDAFFFAGTYYRSHPERARDMDRVFDALARSGRDFVIADRQSDTSSNWNAYPTRFGRWLVDRFDHRVLQRVHKLFDWNINFNIVTTSTTMCAMRIYELQAMGCNIVSNHALAVERKFPQVVLLRDERALEEFLRNPPRVAAHDTVTNVNRMLREHSVWRRVHQILAVCGLDYPLPQPPEIETITGPAVQRDKHSAPRLLLVRAATPVPAFIEESLAGCFAFSDTAICAWAPARNGSDVPPYLQQPCTTDTLVDCAAVLIDVERLAPDQTDAIAAAFFGVGAAEGPSGDLTMVKLTVDAQPQ